MNWPVLIDPAVFLPPPPSTSLIPASLRQEPIPPAPPVPAPALGFVLGREPALAPAAAVAVQPGVASPASQV